MVFSRNPNDKDIQFTKLHRVLGVLESVHFGKKSEISGPWRLIIIRVYACVYSFFEGHDEDNEFLFKIM